MQKNIQDEWFWLCSWQQPRLTPHTRASTHARIHIHTLIQLHIQGEWFGLCSWQQPRLKPHTSTHACIICIRTCIHTYIHTYIHAYKHLHIQDKRFGVYYRNCPVPTGEAESAWHPAPSTRLTEDCERGGERLYSRRRPRDSVLTEPRDNRRSVFSILRFSADKMHLADDRPMTDPERWPTAKDAPNLHRAPPDVGQRHEFAPIDWFWDPIFCTNWDVRDVDKLSWDLALRCRALSGQVPIREDKNLGWSKKQNCFRGLSTF